MAVNAVKRVMKLLSEFLEQSNSVCRQQVLDVEVVIDRGIDYLGVC